MPVRNKSLNNTQNQQPSPKKKTAGKTEPDYIPTKEKNPDDFEIIEE